jgi:hypothetical protein
VLGFRILEGVVDGIILTRALCDTNVGFLYKDFKRVFKGSTALYNATHQRVCRRRI